MLYLKFETTPVPPDYSQPRGQHLCIRVEIMSPTSIFPIHAKPIEMAQPTPQREDTSGQKHPTQDT